MKKKWCLGTFQDLKIAVYVPVDVQTFISVSRHIDQSFIIFWGVFFFIIHTSTCNFLMLNSVRGEKAEEPCQGLFYLGRPDEPCESGRTFLDDWKILYWWDFYF